MSDILTVADACFPAGFKSGHNAYLSYCDGDCAFQPNPLGLPVQYVISSRALFGRGKGGDCEPLNPPPASWPPYILDCRARGEDPFMYCADDSLSSFFNGYKYSDVWAAFASAGVEQPWYWLALPNASSVPNKPRVVAVQTGQVLAGALDFDISIVRTSGWPGILPGVNQEQAMFVFRNDDDGGEYTVGEFTVDHISDPGKAALYLAVLPLEHGNTAQLGQLQSDAVRRLATVADAVAALLPAGAGGLTAAQAAQLAAVADKVGRDLA